MMNNETEQDEDWEQWSRKIKEHQLLLLKTVFIFFFYPDSMLCCFTVAVFVVNSAEKLP